MNRKKQTGKKKDETRRALISAAADVFAEKGFDGARVDEIATRAGLNKALINYHFGSKNQLFQAIIQEFGNSFLERLKADLNTQEPAVDQLRCFVRSIGRLTGDFPQLPRILLLEAATGARHMDKPPPHGPQAIMILNGILMKGAQEGTLRHLNPIFAYFHLVSSVAFFHITSGMRSKLAQVRPFPESHPFAGDLQSLDSFMAFLEDQIVTGFSPLATEEDACD